MSTITRLEARDGSCRFYTTEVRGSTTIVTYGKIGSEGNAHEKQHASNAVATDYAANLIAKQCDKGFGIPVKRKRGEEETEGPQAKNARVSLSRAVKDKANDKLKSPKTASPKNAPKQQAATTKVGGKNASKSASKKTTKSSKSTKKTTKKATKKSTTKKPTKKPTAKKATKQAPKKAAKKATPKKASVAKTPKKKAATKQEKPIVPAEWEVQLSSGGYGIYVDATHVYTGEEDGLVQQFDKAGTVQKQYRLPTGVKCIVGDGLFLYVGTNDGCLYDITTGVPRLMSKIEEFAEVYWMDVRHGRIAAADESGKVALINTEGETIWVKQTEGREGWMCLMDESGVYYGNDRHIGKLELADGAIIWNVDAKDIYFGQQDTTHVYATNCDNVCKVNKKDGIFDAVFSGGGPSFAVAKDSKIIVAAEHFKILSENGDLLHSFQDFAEWEDLPNSMASWAEHEYYGITDHILVKYDLSPEALGKAKGGLLKAQSFTAQSLAEVMPETTVEVTTTATDGILCECVKEEESGKLRIRVISSGYNNTWNVQFPRDFREEAAKYVVERIVEEEGFYRAWGTIKKVDN